MSLIGISFAESRQHKQATNKRATDIYARRLQKISGLKGLSAPQRAPLVSPFLLRAIAALALVATLATVAAVVAIYFPTKPL